jgi:hypothetical protein
VVTGSTAARKSTAGKAAATVPTVTVPAATGAAAPVPVATAQKVLGKALHGKKPMHGPRPADQGDVAQGIHSGKALEEYVAGQATQAAQKKRIAAVMAVLDGPGSEQERAKALRTLLEGADADDKRALAKALNKLGNEPEGKANPDEELAKDWKDGGYPYANLLRRSVYEKRNSACRLNCSSCRPGSRKPASAWSSSSKGVTQPARAAPSSASWSI